MHFPAGRGVGGTSGAVLSAIDVEVTVVDVQRVSMFVSPEKFAHMSHRQSRHMVAVTVPMGFTAELVDVGELPVDNGVSGGGIMENCALLTGAVVAIRRPIKANPHDIPVENIRIQ